ncbi:MAG: hypothetical protein KGI25_08315, partial [Thaumarchaeota archaeon]|nr:hypothetical protein [Nitrososphaerota archaeon]
KAYELQNTADKDEAGRQARKDIPNLDYVSQVSSMLKDSPAMRNWFDNYIGGPGVAQTSKIAPEYSPLVMAQASRLLTDSTRAKGAAGAYFGMIDSIRDAQAKGLTKSADGIKAVDAGIVNPITHAITNPNIPHDAALNAAWATFYSPELLDLFKKSEIQPDGSISPGRDTLLTQVVNDKVTKAIKKFGDTRLWNTYINSSYQFIKSTIRDDVQELNKYQNDPNIQLTWDGDSQHRGFTVHYIGPAMAKGTNTVAGPISGDWLGIPQSRINTAEEVPAHANFRNIKDSITKINNAIQAARTISESTGQPLDAFMLHLLQDSGLDLRNLSDTQAAGMVRAMMAARPGASPL